MIYLVDLAAILQAYGLANIDVRAVGEEFVLQEANGSRVQLDRRQLTKLFFGPERVSDFAAELLPLPFWQWGLEKV